VEVVVDQEIQQMVVVPVAVVPVDLEQILIFQSVFLHIL